MKNIFISNLFLILILKINTNQNFGTTIEDVMNYIDSIHISKAFTRSIKGYDWDFRWDYYLNSSISKYLFEEQEIIEHIAPNKYNRPGISFKKEFIIHDATQTAKE